MTLFWREIKSTKVGRRMLESSHECKQATFSLLKMPILIDYNFFPSCSKALQFLLKSGKINVLHRRGKLMIVEKFKGNYNVNYELSKRIVAIFDEYNYFDLCRAVFCINSWRYTRPHLCLYITLNYSLAVCKKKGNKPLKTYEEFLLFCDKLFKEYDTLYDDAIIPDFGEIKISYNEHFYPVLMGTGHDFVFPFLHSIDLLARKSKQRHVFEEVLIYVEKIINQLGREELFVSEKYEVHELSIPSESFFVKVSNFYKIISLTEESMLGELSFDKTLDINISHFIKNKNDEYYPLFNPSIVVDYFNQIIKKAFETIEAKQEATDFLVYGSLKSNFDISPEADFVLCNIGVVEDEENKKILDEKLVQFAVFDEKSVLIFINEESIKDWNVEKYGKEVKNLLKEKKLKIIQFLEDVRLYDFSDRDTVEIIIYDSNITLGQMFKFSEKGKLLRNYIYDIISIIYLAKKPSDIAAFIGLINNETIRFVPGHGGLSVGFDSWLTNNKEFSQGAIEYNNIVAEVYSLEWGVFEKFVSLNKWYPFEGGTQMFENPFRWIIDDDKGDFIRISNKAAIGFGGDLRKVKNSYVFLAFNLFFEDFTKKKNKRSETIRMIEELLQRNLIMFEKELISCDFYGFNGVQLTYMPIEYARKVDNNGFLNEKRKYVYSDIYFEGNKVLIRYAVNEENLFENILNSTNKSVECDFMKELLKCFERTCLINYAKLCAEIDKKRTEKKDIEALAIKIDYYYSEDNMGINIDEQSYIKVRKKIAYDCKGLNLEAGIYESKHATKLIRDIQGITIPRFEEEINKFDKIELHKELVSILAYHMHNKHISMKRFSLSGNQYLSEEARIVTSMNSIKNREDSKNSIRDICYLIDTNLAIEHHGSLIPSQEELRYLIAFAHWLLVLQECSDEAHYGLFGAKVQISQDYLVSSVFDDDHEELVAERNKRVYNNEDYQPRIVDEGERLKTAIASFYEDTKIGLDAILEICNYLSFEFTYTFKEYEVLPDVFEVPKEKIIEDFGSILIEEKKDKLNYFCNALNYLIIDCSKIKTSADKKCEVVPIWERENRNNRFEIMPIISNGESIIFSPVVMYNLLNLWKWGTIEFYPPFEYGLNNYLKVLSLWKNKCETEMENDIEKFFKSKGYLTSKNLQLHKLDKKFGHPKNLGDYDVLSIDTKKKIVWNIESKFLGKVGSIREYYNHQSSFFINDKKDEKFSRRINYLAKNLVVVLKAMAISDGDTYLLKNYMVTNKVFVADIKKIDFEIITFDELKKLIGE